MKSSMIAMSAVAMFAGSALATISPVGPTSQHKDPSFNPLPPFQTRGTTGGIVSVDVSGIESWDALGSANNTVLVLDLAAALGLPSGTPMSMTSVGWDVTLEALGTSWLSELRVGFADSANNFGVFLRPGAGTNNPGTGSFSSGGQVDLTDVGVPNLFLADGVLRLDFHESFDDAANVLDGVWLSGSLFVGVDVPAPGAAALLGLGGLTAARRRRN